MKRPDAKKVQTALTELDKLVSRHGTDVGLTAIRRYLATAQERRRINKRMAELRKQQEELEARQRKL